jgi:hypothetical protein
MVNIMTTNLMNQLMSQSLGENGIIINQIINMISSITFDPKNKLKFIAGVLCIVPKILVMLGAKHLVNHTDGITTLMYETIKNLLYRKKEHIIANSDGLGSCLSNIINKTGEHNWSSFKFLITNNIDIVTLYTLRLIPKSSSYYKLIEQANKDKAIKINISSVCKKVIIGSDGKMA